METETFETLRGCSRESLGCSDSPWAFFFRTSFDLEIVLESQRWGLCLSQLICWLCF